MRTAVGDVAIDELVEGPPIDPGAVVRRGLDDVIAVLYTSGTTGRPKGCAITNRGMMANLWNMAFVQLRESVISERPPAPEAQPATLSAGPLFHIGGMTAILGGPMGGVKMVMMHKWDLEEALRLAKVEDITTFGGVPTMVRQILDRPGVEDSASRSGASRWAAPPCRPTSRCGPSSASATASSCSTATGSPRPHRRSSPTSARSSSSPTPTAWAAPT